MPDTPHILVVDDNENMRDLLTRAVRQMGFAASSVGDGQQALACLHEQKIDLVLLDIMMPVMDGITTLTEIKASPRSQAVPVIMISADTDTDYVVRCITLGAEDYLFKPFNMVLLHARIKSGLTRRFVWLEQESSRAELEGCVVQHTQLAEQCASELAHSQLELQQQTAILNAILNSLGDGVIVVDTAGRLIHQNPAAQQILGEQISGLIPAQADAQSRYCSEHGTIYRPEDLPLTRAMQGIAVDGMELRPAQPAEALGTWLSITARPLRDQRGTLMGGVAVVRDISVAKQQAIILRETEERYALAARGANDGLWDWDMRANRIVFSPRWKAMLGYADTEIGTQPEEWFGRVHRDDYEQLELRLQAHFRRVLTYFEHEYRMLHHDGTYRWMLCRGLAIWDTAGQAVRMAGSQTDISSRKVAEQRLRHEALHDALTGLPNRALLMSEIERVVTQTQRAQQQQFAIMFLDLDRFKIINDSLGHQIGDQLLTVTARRIAGCLRSGDMIARLGGDEFVVLLDEIACEMDVAAMAERIQQAVSLPLHLDHQEVVISASIGITICGADTRQPADIIRDADIAMYQAKMQGKACHVIFDPSMHKLIKNRLQLESDLRRALENHELRVHYQPIVALISQRVIGFEALLRWQHPEHGLRSPNEFLHIAEETGLIVPIGWWVLREACQQLQSWTAQFPAAGGLSMNVNLSGKQLSQPDAIKQIRTILKTSGLAAQRLKLEITEHTLIEYGQLSGDVLAGIRELGVQLCIDDFGTGYSSLSYLHQLPVDVLKIDRSFIKRLGPNGENGEIVKTIITLARTLGVAAVAEGTETVVQAEWLRQSQCDYGQGWLFAKALPAETASELIRSL